MGFRQEQNFTAHYMSASKIQTVVAIPTTQHVPLLVHNSLALKTQFTNLLYYGARDIAYATHESQQAQVPGTACTAGAQQQLHPTTEVKPHWETNFCDIDTRA